MRTKALALTAAISAIGAAAIAGEVTSVNCVGFINLDLKSGYNLIANQLNGPNESNHINVIFPNVPVDTQLTKYDAVHQVWTPADYFTGTEWKDFDTEVPSQTFLKPGEAAFLNVPEDVKVTLVGEVPQGDALTVTLPPNYSLASSVVPQQLFLVASNFFPVTPDMTYLTYDAANQVWNSSAYWNGDNARWQNSDTEAPMDVNPAVGQGFFINNPLDSMDWVRAFHVQ